MKTIVIVIMIIAFKCYLLHEVFARSADNPTPQQEQIVINLEDDIMNKQFQYIFDLMGEASPLRNYQRRIDGKLSMKTAEACLNLAGNQHLADELQRIHKEDTQK